MKPNRPRMCRSGLAAMLALLLAACASDGPAPTLLTLPAVARSESPAPPNAPVLAVRQLGLPEYVQARRVRYRADASTLLEWPNTFWAEPIEVGLSREFQAALRQALPGWQLCVSDCAEHAPALSLQVELAPLDFVRSQQKLQARARIAISAAGAAPRMLQTLERNFELPARADTPQAHAQALSDLMQALAPAVAEALRQARR